MKAIRMMKSQNQRHFPEATGFVALIICIVYALIIFVIARIACYVMDRTIFRWWGFTETKDLELPLPITMEEKLQRKKSTEYQDLLFSSRLPPIRRIRSINRGDSR